MEAKRGKCCEKCGLGFEDFWHRLTGDSSFYSDLAEAIGKVAIEADYTSELNQVVRKLASRLEL